MYYRGKNAPGRYVAVYCMKNRLGINRLGLTVGGKVGGAVVRNRIRRRISESFRLMSPQLKQGFDIVIVARARAVEADYRRLDADIRAQLVKLGILT